MGDRTVCVGVVVFDGDSVLLIRHSESARPPTGCYGLSAGRVKPWESLEVAACRELREESGLEAVPECLYKLPSVRKETLQLKNGPEDFEFHTYVCWRYSGELRESPEGVPEWVDRDSVRELFLFHENVVDIVDEAYGVFSSG